MTSLATQLAAVAGSARVLHAWVDAGWLRPANPNPGAGRPAGWTTGDLADARVIRALRDTVGIDRRVGAAGPLPKRMADAYRAAGRPDHGWIVKAAGTVRWTADPDVILAAIHDGASVVAVRIGDWP